MIRHRRLLLALLGFAAGLAAAEDRDPLPFMAAGAPAGSAIELFYRYVPGSRDPASGAAPIMVQERARGRFVIKRTETDTWTAQETVGHLNLTESPTVPGTGLHVPDSLWDIVSGAAYHHQMGDRRSWGANLSVGSASDKPYNSLHETLVRLNGNIQLPASGKNSWLLFLAYSNNRHFLNNIPLPGFAYVWNHPEQHVWAIAGFPFAAVRYRPDPWSFRASIFGPRNLSLEAARRLARETRAYTGLDWGQQEWQRAGRLDHSNRLILSEKKAAVGLRFPVLHRLEGDVSTGWDFDRRFFENTSSSTRDVPVASLRNSWLLEARLTWRLGPGAEGAPNSGRGED
jgi:hypothetical protein